VLAFLLAWSSALADDEADRLARIQSLSAAEKQELARKRMRFEELPSDEQQRLRELSASIEAHPHAENLKQTMARYHAWLKTLTANQLADVRQLSGKQKVEYIAKLQEQQRQEQQQRQWRKLAEQSSPEDLETVYRWLEEFIDRHRSQLLRSLPGDFGRRIAEMDDRRQQTLLLMHMIVSTPFAPGAIRPGRQDVEQLIPKLSPAAQDFFNQTTEFPRRIQLLTIWNRAAFWSKAFPEVGSEQLASFFDTLPADERDRLERLSTDDRDAELRMQYAREQLFKAAGIRPPSTTEPREPGRDGPRRRPR
jgi:hypothetical protein